MKNLLATEDRINKSVGRMLVYDKRFSIIYWGTMVSFVANKLFIRPMVLEHHAPEFLQILVLSYPNFAEAIVGSFVLINMLVYANERYITQEFRLKERGIYVLGLFLSAVYVITQEFKIHNLGGRNVYDPNDVLFSVLGLVASYLLLRYVVGVSIGSK